MAELVAALDVPAAKDALVLSKKLSGILSWLKVGLELFIAAGPELVSRLKDDGFKIFLDLKFYDIPHTVGRATASAARLEVDMLTLHCQGGQRMCEAARKAAHNAEHPPLLFGVTVLTSFRHGEMPGLSIAPEDFAQSLAQSALSWKLDGIVCSGLEAARIKTLAPGLLCLCPGVRLPEDEIASDDQARIMTPLQAVQAGADFIVAGRPIIQAGNPAEAALRFLDNMRQA